MATAAVYGNHLLGQYSATAARRVDWVTDTIKCTLHTATYAPNQDTHTFASDLTNELATGGGYTAGGVTLASKTTAYDSATNQTRLDAADVSVGGDEQHVPLRGRLEGHGHSGHLAADRLRRPRCDDDHGHYVHDHGIRVS
jgi:hypothetical protein